MRLNIARLPCILCLALLAMTAQGNNAAPPAPLDPFLAQLAGDWDLVGSVGNKPAHYRGTGRWVLKQGWLCLTLNDLATGGYQASVYLSHDATAADYIAHWLDQFGAAGARVVGSGRRDAQTLVLQFPYVEGAFRDTLTLSEDGNTGSLLLESQQKDGHWTTFASYRMTRLHKLPSPAGAGAAPDRQ
jgi:hypothetical protein